MPWFRERGYEAQAITLRRHDQRHAPGLRTIRIKEYASDRPARVATTSLPLHWRRPRRHLDLLFFERPNIEGGRRTPLLVIGADADSTISPAEVATTAKTYGAQLATFPGAHDLMLEPGWEKVAERIDSFIRSKVGAAV